MILRCALSPLLIFVLYCSRLFLLPSTQQIFAIVTGNFSCDRINMCSLLHNNSVKVLMNGFVHFIRLFGRQQQRFNRFVTSLANSTNVSPEIQNEQQQKTKNNWETNWWQWTNQMFALNINIWFQHFVKRAIFFSIWEGKNDFLFAKIIVTFWFIEIWLSLIQIADWDENMKNRRRGNNCTKPFLDTIQKLNVLISIE